MRAVAHDPTAPQGLAFAEVPDPSPAPSEALVGVAAISLNFADVAYLSRHTAGAIPGFDASGIVLTAAADGSGPPAGSRVTTFGWSAAWAERRTVDTAEMAELPDTIDLVDAAAIPVAGVTALRALRRLGSLEGRRILITGASGGVGRFAVQLAAHAGAHVVASVGNQHRIDGLEPLGAAEVVVGLTDIHTPVDGVLDNIGGRILADAYMLLAPDGVVQSVGMASGQTTTIDFEAARLRGGGRIEAFTVGPRFGPDLAHLVELVAAGRLDPQIDWRGPWDKIAEASAALLDRRVRGKAVLEVSR